MKGNRMTDNDFDATPTVVIAYHSGFGHTSTLAEAVAVGARAGDARVGVLAVDSMDDADWDTLDGADGIVFGSATYMGNVSAGFQAFAEKTGRRCLNGSWRDRWPPGSPIPGPRAATSCPR
jgi:multimeric flavodoxin WrbA